MNLIPESQDTSALEDIFDGLLRRWREETALFSSSTRITAHPAYQEIIGLGGAVLPLLFRELDRTRDGHLSAALTALTGSHPVALEERGQIKKVAEAWLRWGRENRY